MDATSSNRKRLLRQLGLLIVLGLLYLGGVYVRRDTGENPSSDHSNGWNREGMPENAAAEAQLLSDLAAKPLVLTRHGRCRMECREISLDEVRSILREGRLNRAKSEPKDQPCPAWAVEGQTDDGQNVRIVYSGCTGETRVITAIDLDREYACVCD